MKVFLKAVVMFLSVLIWMPSIYCAETTNCAGIEESQSKYLADNQYNEFVDSLNNSKYADKVSQLCLEFYTAQARYLQLKYLEETQSWDDYFTNGNDYRQQLEQNAQKVVEQADTNNPLRLKARLLLWQFHHDQQDAFTQTSLDDLVTDVGAYAKAKSDPELIKSLADSLLAYEEKAVARRIYKLYVDQLAAGKITDSELKNIAAAFYKEGNLNLSESVFDIYIKRISKTLEPGNFIEELFEIASLFVYKPQGLYDMAYAEGIYAQIEALGQKDVFNQAAIYLRAFNLEKLEDYKGAVVLYSQLIQLYPDTENFDEAVYKMAMINAYALANIDQARKYFDLLAAKKEFSAHVIASFYQLGLLAQWEGDLAKAKEYYGLLLENAADKYPLIVAQGKDRLNEIQDNQQLGYSLKTFLDLSLKSDNLLSEMGKTELRSSSYVLDKDQKVTISSLVNMPQSGCNQVQLQYLWSGDLGGANPAVTDASFEPVYPDRGTKAVNLVIISPAGSIDCSFTMVDVY